MSNLGRRLKSNLDTLDGSKAVNSALVINDETSESSETAKVTNNTVRPDSFDTNLGNQVNVNSGVKKSSTNVVQKASFNALSNSQPVNSFYNNITKRLIDIFASSIALVVFTPVAIIIAALLKYNNSFKKNSVFFCQPRPGLNGEIFKIYKFKTMTDDTDEEGNLLPDEARLTPIGKIIRSLSLDEIPQLINVLKGEMSLVGPRPQLAEYLPLYNESQARRHLVRPGITGLAQIKGRNLISWEKRFKYDVFYVDNLSLLLDIKIIAMTVVKVLCRHGVEYEQPVEMAKFIGTKSNNNKVIPLGDFTSQTDDKIGEEDINLVKRA